MANRALFRVMVVAVLLESSFGVHAQNIHISDQVKADRSDCVDYLRSDIGTALASVRASDSTVFLGYYGELQEQLVLAGLQPSKANSVAQVLAEVHAAAYNFPALQHVAAMLDKLMQEKKLLVCVASKTCLLGRAESNFMFFTDQNEAILIAPPPAHDNLSFAINFLGTMGATAADNVLVHWMHAEFEKESRVHGSADGYYRRYANYDGHFPPKVGSLDQGFTLTFSSAYQVLTSYELTRYLRPNLSRQNFEHLARATYLDLRYGRHREVTAPILAQLGITEQNFLEKAQTILATLSKN